MQRISCAWPRDVVAYFLLRGAGHRLAGQLVIIVRLLGGLWFQAVKELVHAFETGDS